MEYAEGAAIACVIAMVGGMWVFLQRLVGAKLKEMQDILVKLIDRHNKSDSSADRRLEMTLAKIDELEVEVSGLKEKISYLQGRINGHAPH